MQKGAYFLAVLLAVSLVSAQITVTHTGEDNVQPGGAILFTVYLINEGSKFYNLNILPDPLVNLPSSPFESIVIQPSVVDLEGSRTVPINVTVTLKEDIRTKKNYGTFIVVKALNDPSVNIEHQLAVYALDPKEILSFTASASEAISPGSTMHVDVAVKNKIGSNLEKVLLVATSDLFTENRALVLFPKQERLEQFSFEIPGTTPPGEHMVQVKLYYKDQLVDSTKMVFSVLENSDIKEASEIRSSFLTKKYIISRTNVGNSVADDSIALQLSALEGIFADFSQEPNSKRDGEYRWEFTLPQGSTFRLEAEVSYLPLAIAVVFMLLIGGFGWYVATRGMTITKKTLTIKQQRDGTTELRIMMHIANRTGRLIRNAMVYEFLPRFVHPAMQFGTLKPKSLQKGKGGVRLVWSLDNIAKGEERIISYEVTSKLDVIGRFMLPPSWIKYKDSKGKVSRAKSNHLFVTARIDELEKAGEKSPYK
ncbi:hypothetical protein HY501_02675 [Candidatus Woesearchaeota archaeon]|nr:hypothetical protein [Candidatus Woesearchaeota archaeon]